MLKLIKHAEIYAPEYLGRKDILIAHEKIAAVADEIIEPDSSIPLEVIDASEYCAVPGFIDSHIHIQGGGGEGGYATRTPEIQLSEITTAGITTVIGCLGTDGVTRSMAGLLAKSRALDEEGVTTYIYTGSYQIPVTTLTGKIETDIIYIDKIMGVGELAMSDHRSSQPDIEDFARIAGAARVAGMLSGKAGIVNIHMGDGSRKLSFIEAIVQMTELPYSQFIPTHIGRNPELFKEGIRYAEKGGFIDLTTSTTREFLKEGEIKCSKALKTMMEAGVDLSHVTFTSDGQGSLPEFDENGNFRKLGIGRCTSLFSEVRDAVLQEGIDLSQALRVITTSPADILKLRNKGRLAVEKDADIVLLTRDNLAIDTVIARGRILVRHGKPLVKGTFEN